MSVTPQLLDDLVAWLTLQGVAGDTNWPIAASFQPPGPPDQCVTLYETPGEVPDAAHPDSTEDEYNYPGIQVRVRGTTMDYAGARSKIEDVFLALHKADIPLSASQKPIVYIYALNSAPLPMGLDNNNRPELTWNFKVMRKR